MVHLQQLEEEALGSALPTFNKSNTPQPWRTTDGIKHPVFTKTLTAEELAEQF